MVKSAKSPLTLDGAMAEWLGRALQKLARRFDSGSCLQSYFLKNCQLTNQSQKNRKAT